MFAQLEREQQIEALTKAVVEQKSKLGLRLQASDIDSQTATPGSNNCTLHYTALHCTAMHCTALSIALHCTVLHLTVQHSKLP